MTRPRTMPLPCARVIEGDTNKAIARNLRTRLSGMVPPNDFKWSSLRDRIVDHASPCETAFLFMPRSAPQSYFHLYTLSNHFPSYSMQRGTGSLFVISLLQPFAGALSA